MMNNPFLFALIFSVSFLTTLLGTSILIRKILYLKENNPAEAGIFFGQDMAKSGKVLVPTMGGLAITFGFGFSILMSLRMVDTSHVIALLGALVTMLLIAIIGFIDDVFIIRRVWRIIVPGIAALPLIAVETGTPTINLLGHDVYLGGIYTYLLVPLAVIACANFINILAGFNGLEAGTGAIACLSIFVASLILLHLEPDKYSIATPIIMIAMVGACIAFLFFNWYPARIFPGNIGTYVMGAAIASAVIIGDIEKVGIIALFPQMIEFLLKLKSGLTGENFGTLEKGRLVYKGEAVSLTHLIMKYVKVDERKLVFYLLALQAVFGILAVSSIFWYR